mmetsp:Transcript_59360/g.94420  ORF Transcript_59360/g.94420 Transcript_59360/m.94420 type:complete len:282 (-) Transcript_59360:12-857(-)
MAEQKQEEPKALKPFLMRPFAIMRLFHEAARIGFKDMKQGLADCEGSLSTENVAKLVATFNELKTCIDIHKDHEDKALYPALAASIKSRLDAKNYNPSKEQLEAGLKEIPSFTEEHSADHEKLHAIESALASLSEAVQKDSGSEEAKKALVTASEEIKKWLEYHEGHLQHEEKVMAPLMKGIAGSKPEKVKIARTLLDVNCDLVVQHQFGYAMRQLLKVPEWYCPMTKHTYKGNEILIAYLNCFRMMSKDAAEYKQFTDVAVKILSADQWKEMQSYALDKK